MEDDIYSYLKMDHKKVAKLFELFESATTEKNQIEIIQMIKKELLVHAIAEQETFYKALEAHAESREDTLHAEEEHAQILAKLDEIALQSKISPAKKQKLMELKKIVEHHVSEEEGKIFREAKKVLTEKEAFILKFKMHDFKEKILNGEIISETEKVF